MPDKGLDVQHRSAKCLLKYGYVLDFSFGIQVEKANGALQQNQRFNGMRPWMHVRLYIGARLQEIEHALNRGILLSMDGIDEPLAPTFP